MFNVPPAKAKEFEKLFETHQVQVSACDVFLQNIRLLNGRHHILDRKTFEQYYKNFTADIELETSPMDSFIPNDIQPTDTPDEIDPEELMKQRLFYVNRTEEAFPEYFRIKKRVTEEELKSTLGETHPVIMALLNNEVTYDDVIDDIAIYWAVYKYIEQITIIRLQIFSNMTPLIDYVAEHFDSARILRNTIHTKNINGKKIGQYRNDLMFFGPDYTKICECYKDAEKHPEIPVHFDLDHLINLLLTNTDIKADRLIVLGIYLIASFAVSDFMNPETPDMRCRNYVTDVLALVLPEQLSTN